MRKFFVNAVGIAALAAAFGGRLQAHVPFAPDRWLDNGGIASDMSPEFYWEEELRRMAREFAPPEKRVAPPAAKIEPGQDEPSAGAAAADFTGRADAADFEDAIKTGRIKPPEPEKAKRAHEAARRLVSAGKVETAALPADEFPSEFADYHRGALGFRSGAAHYDEARAAWEALLKRPETERHYRSVWAAFMLGKLALAVDDPAAVKWFRQTRELARAGFADSLGLAADSYGWEARSELKQQHLEPAAKLYLAQLALGDDSAIVSLKAVIPDRPSIGGILNFGADPPDNASDEVVKKWEQAQAPQIQKRLDECARSPLLRRLVTAHVLATETQEAFWSYGAEAPEDGSKPGERCLRWLATLEKAELRQIDDADQVGWVAYTAGRYKEAARWLAMARAETPTALWLKAKLERRDGKFGEAAASMAAAFQAIRADVLPFKDSEFTYGDFRGYEPDQSVAGDLAGLHLTRGEFVQAMDVFLQGKLWRDAAFVGDRVLTADELKAYVDAHFPQVTAVPKDHEDSFPGSRYWQFDPAENAFRIRWMLARRLVREHRLGEAKAYFPQEKERAALRRYTAAWKDAEDTHLPKLQRARALFTAAWIARHNGLEIMGTEEEPDGFVSDGQFPAGYADTERVEGVRVHTDYDEKQERDVAIKKPARLSIPATTEEKRRIIGNEPHPSERFHYRWVAAELAWRAAALLSDGTEELADVLNTGGSWIKDRDDKAADKFIQAIERRCPHTSIGVVAAAKHWFISRAGPWSEVLEKEDAAASPDASKRP